MISEALKMYLNGYGAEEIEEKTGIKESQYKTLLTKNAEEIHNSALDERWNRERTKLLNCGIDLSRIKLARIHQC